MRNEKKINAVALALFFAVALFVTASCDLGSGDSGPKYNASAETRINVKIKADSSNGNRYYISLPTEKEATEEDAPTLKFSATVIRALNNEVTWESSDPEYASVDQTGKVTGLKACDDDVKFVTITATSKEDETKYDSVNIKVINGPYVPVQTIELSGRDSVFLGKTITYTAKVVPEDATEKDVIVKLSDLDSVTFENSKEKSKTLKAGNLNFNVMANKVTDPKKKVAITAYTIDWTNGCKEIEFSETKKELTVTEDYVPVESISLDKGVVLFLGRECKLKVNFTPEEATNKKVDITYADDGLEELVDSKETQEDGTIKLKIKSDADLGDENKKSFTITAVTVLDPEVDGDDWTQKSVTATITVQRPVDKIEITPQPGAITEEEGTNYLLVGKTVTLTAKATPENATDKGIIWESSDTEIAEVSESGVVTAKKAGSVTITAKAKDGAGTEEHYDLFAYKALDSIKVSLDGIAEGGELTANSEKEIKYTLEPSDLEVPENSWKFTINSDTTPTGKGDRKTEVSGMKVMAGNIAENLTLTATIDSKILNPSGASDKITFKVVLDKSKLNTAIEKANAKKKEIDKTGTVTEPGPEDIGKYLKDTVDALDKAISKAESVNSDEKTNQTAIDDATSDLNDAIDGLKIVGLHAPKELNTVAHAIIFSSDPTVTLKEGGPRANLDGREGPLGDPFFNGQKPENIFNTDNFKDFETEGSTRKVKKITPPSPRGGVSFADVAIKGFSEDNYIRMHLSLLSKKAVKIGVIAYSETKTNILYTIDPDTKKVTAGDEEVDSKFNGPDENQWTDVTFKFTEVGTIDNYNIIVFDYVEGNPTYYLDNVYFYEEEHGYEHFQKSLRTKIEEAQALYDDNKNSIANDDNPSEGKYPASAGKALQEAISTAEGKKALTDKGGLKDAISDLQKAMDAFTLSQNIPFKKSTNINDAYFANPKNIAVGKTATASSTSDAADSPDQAIDGNTGTRWQTNVDTQAKQDDKDHVTFTVDLGSVSTFDRIAFKWEAASSLDYDILISDSENGSYESICHIKTDAREEFQLITFQEPKKAQYVRFQHNGGPNETNRAFGTYGPSFYEMGIFAPEDKIKS